MAVLSNSSSHNVLKSPRSLKSPRTSTNQSTPRTTSVQVVRNDDGTLGLSLQRSVKGFKVMEIADTSKAALQVGDVVLAVDEKELKGVPSFLDFINKLEHNKSEFTFTVKRKSERKPSALRLLTPRSRQAMPREESGKEQEGGKEQVDDKEHKKEQVGNKESPALAPVETPASADSMSATPGTETDTTIQAEEARSDEQTGSISADAEAEALQLAAAITIQAHTKGAQTRVHYVYLRAEAEARQEAAAATRLQAMARGRALRLAHKEQLLTAQRNEPSPGLSAAMHRMGELVALFRMQGQGQ